MVVLGLGLAWFVSFSCWWFGLGACLADILISWGWSARIKILLRLNYYLCLNVEVLAGVQWVISMYESKVDLKLM